jgi:hypothetical protein
MFVGMSTNYRLRPPDYLLKHVSLPTALLHDLDVNPDNLVIQALVASGDCFEMIASNLDQISRSLSNDSPLQFQLEHTIRTLLYLQRHYKVIKKFPDH